MKNVIITCEEDTFGVRPAAMEKHITPLSHASEPILGETFMVIGRIVHYPDYLCDCGADLSTYMQVIGRLATCNDVRGIPCINPKCKITYTLHKEC